jgi:membrane associated rhomboid family serine protease
MNALVFLLELMGGEPFIRQWSVIPANIVAGKGCVTIFSAMFIHGGWMHIIGNMVFLHAFGPEVEDAMGRLRFLTFSRLEGLAHPVPHMVVVMVSHNRLFFAPATLYSGGHTTGAIG